MRPRHSREEQTSRPYDVRATLGYFVDRPSDALTAIWQSVTQAYGAMFCLLSSGVYLLNEFGLAFEEVTASSLVKVDVHGRVVNDILV